MELSRDSAPLFDRLAEVASRKPASFHVPGHKAGAGIGGAEAEIFTRIMTIDYTEATGLDDLHHPEGVIADAQALAADCFGAEETCFLVGGSTVGNLAMILAVCEPGDLILVQRNVHKSVIHGLMLAGAKAVFVPPAIDEASGIAAGVQERDVREALERHPEAKALFVSNPNYYGMGIDLAPLAELLHDTGKPLLVDEAHGAHFGFHPGLPRSALAGGADCVVQSTHKMLTAMTMAAMLHIQGGRIDRPLIRQRLAMLQSSSPSYPLMASLDVCRRHLHVQGADAFTRGLDAVQYFCRQLSTLDRFELIEPSPQTTAYTTKDPFKVVVRDRVGGLTGYELQEALEREGGCLIEMADPRHVLLVFSLASTRDDSDRLLDAFRRILRHSDGKKQELRPSAANMIKVPPIGRLSHPIPFSNRFPGLDGLTGLAQGDAPPSTRLVPLAESVGQVAAEMVIPYPPGIPLLFPGEAITADTAHSLTELAQAGARFQGTRDIGAERTIRIYTTPSTDREDS
jgi:arginine/lysine/ornithine decarboxylase